MKEPKQLTAIIADDLQIVRWSVKQFLEEMGVTVLAKVDSIEDLIVSSNVHKPQFIITDIQLNDDDVIKRIPFLNRLGCKVIAYTDIFNNRTIDSFFSSGGICYISKKDPVINLRNALMSAEKNELWISPVFTDDLNNYTDEFQLLSTKEKEVLLLIARGLTNAQIAEEMFISSKTADTHRYRIYKKLKIHSRKDAVAFVLKNGLLDDINNCLN